MKRRVIIAAVIMMVLSGLLLPGCIKVDISEDSGNLVTRDFDLSGFNAVEVGSAFQADISRSDDYSVSVTISETLAEQLEVTKSGETLTVGLKHPVWNFRNIRSRPRVTITLPDLRRLELTGASAGELQGFESSRDFELQLSGASNLDIDMVTGKFACILSGASTLNGYVKATGSDFDISGASRVTLSGTGGDTALDVSGASTANLGDFAFNNADAAFSGASNGQLEASGRLDAAVSGASRLEYGGSPTLGKIEVSGGSSFRPK